MDEEMSDSQKISKLAGIAAALGDEMQRAAGIDVVLQCALVALVRIQPDPHAFARAFRENWQRFGAPNQRLDADDPCAVGIAELLGQLESACPAPLNVRPPGVATEPGQ